jgi:hypothetical protein
VTGHRRKGERGQVLPLFALFLTALLAMAALAIDVSGAYASRRYYRSVGDAAALAGAQDLQIPGSRAISSTERIRARTDAMASLVRQLGITGALPAACSTAADVDVPDTCVLPGTNYHVAIKTPVPACQLCDPNRSVQVGLRNANYELTFARVLGQGTWNVGITSVAGLAFGKSYAIVTLRPPKKVGSTFDVKDITIDGGSIVNVQAGDVGSNSNMNYSGTGSIMNIDSGYGMFYFDPFNGPTWSGPPMPPTQIVEKIPTLINDPGYTYPAMAGSLGTSSCAPAPGSNCAPTFDDARTSSCGAPGAIAACTRADLDSTCLTEAQTKIDATRYTFMTAQLTNPATIYCYNPGIYGTSSSKQLVGGTGDLIVLKPGAYYFESGLDISGRIVGGYEPGQPGVALMFDEAGPGNCSSCVFSGNNALTIALNAGTKFPPGTSGVGATAAHDWDDQLVQTSGPESPTPPLLLTLLVLKDPDCFVPTSAPFIEPSACNAGKNKTLNLAGGGSLAVEGVQYAPTDNVEIHGGSTGTGQIGQIISWTLFYSGGTHINQEGPSNQGPGTLRLDAACTAPSTPCSP